MRKITVVRSKYVRTQLTHLFHRLRLHMYSCIRMKVEEVI